MILGPHGPRVPHADYVVQRELQKGDLAWDALSTVPRAPRPRFVSSFGTLTLGFIAGILVALAVWAAR